MTIKISVNIVGKVSKALERSNLMLCMMVKIFSKLLHSISYTLIFRFSDRDSALQKFQ